VDKSRSGSTSQIFAHRERRGQLADWWHKTVYVENKPGRHEGKSA